MPDPVIEEAIAAACTAPAPHHTRPWSFVVLTAPAAKRRLLAALADAWRRDLEGVTLYHMHTSGPVHFADPEQRGRFLSVSLFTGAALRKPIEEGRAVYDNVGKFLTYILTSNIPELVPYLAYSLARIPLPLTIMQILAVDPRHGSRGVLQRWFLLRRGTRHRRALSRRRRERRRQRARERVSLARRGSDPLLEGDPGRDRAWRQGPLQ